MMQRLARPKRSGRSARIAKRAAKPEVNPCPPGQLGGQYKPLSENDLNNIYDTALRLLAELGMGDVPAKLSELFDQKRFGRPRHVSDGS